MAPPDIWYEAMRKRGMFGPTEAIPCERPPVDVGLAVAVAAFLLSFWFAGHQLRYFVKSQRDLRPEQRERYFTTGTWSSSIIMLGTNDFLSFQRQ